MHTYNEDKKSWQFHTIQELLSGNNLSQYMKETFNLHINTQEGKHFNVSSEDIEKSYEERKETLMKIK